MPYKFQLDVAAEYSNSLAFVNSATHLGFPREPITRHSCDSLNEVFIQLARLEEAAVD
jgi:hypothetical protein